LLLIAYFLRYGFLNLSQQWVVYPSKIMILSTSPQCLWLLVAVCERIIAIRSLLWRLSISLALAIGDRNLLILKSNYCTRSWPIFVKSKRRLALYAVWSFSYMFSRRPLWTRFPPSFNRRVLTTAVYFVDQTVIWLVTHRYLNNLKIY